MIAGIDFSIKSPAVTLFTKEGEWRFYTFARQSVAKEDFFLTLQQNGVHVICLPDEAPLPKSANLTERERSSITDGLMQTRSISKMLSAWSFKEDGHMAIEGFSFGSTGNRLAQISGYQWLLRSLLLKDCEITPEQLWFFSPMTIKATAGKGNFKKEQMIEAFINSDCNSRFAEALRTKPAEFQTKKGAWLKPIDDIVDSYWIAKTLEKTLNTK
jgi:hypothetical protein